MRPAASGDFAAHWPEASRLLPDYGREVDRTLLIELERDLDVAAPQVPDAAIEVARVVSALRLATPGPIAAVLSLRTPRLDPYDVRPGPHSPLRRPQGS